MDFDGKWFATHDELITEVSAIMWKLGRSFTIKEESKTLSHVTTSDWTMKGTTLKNDMYFYKPI